MTKNKCIIYFVCNYSKQKECSYYIKDSDNLMMCKFYDEIDGWCASIEAQKLSLSKKLKQLKGE